MNNKQKQEWCRISDFIQTLNYLKTVKFQRQFLKGELKPLFVSDRIQVFKEVER